MTKRNITPHKGGRTDRVNGFRLTSEEKKRLDNMLSIKGLSLADYIIECLARDEEEIKQAE